MEKPVFKILTGDNNPEDRKIVQEFLEKNPLCEYQFFEAGCAEEVLSLSRSMSFDCILLGHCLPDMDCTKILAELAKAKNQDPAPIVVLTGEADEELAVKVVRSGSAVDYLIKEQMTSNVLAKMVQYAISSTQLEKELRQYRGKFKNRMEAHPIKLQKRENWKRHEQQGRDLEESNRILIEDIPIGILLINTKGTIFELNTAVLKMFAYNSREDFIGISASALYDDPKYRDRFIELHQKNRVINFETQLRRKDGTVFWGRVTSIFRKAVGGASLHIKTIEDITEHRKEKEQFQTLIEEAPIGVTIIGQSGDYKYVNPMFIKLFGYTPQDILTGREWFRRAFPDKEDRSRVISNWFSYIKKTGDSAAMPQIFQVTDNEGNKKTIRFLISLMASGNYLIIYEDISKEKKLEAQLIQAQKMEAIGRLAGGVAHDFNNRLTAIIGYSDLILEKLEADDPIRNDMGVIIQSADRAASLTRQLLAFSRKQILQPIVLDLNDLITQLVKMLGRLIGEDIKIETVLEPDLLQVTADPGQMEQILMNLSINAKDAMLHGGKLIIETANVDLDESHIKNQNVEFKPGPYVMLAVSDTGIGMDEKIQACIFDPFFTTKEAGKGTGLGLSTVYGIVKQTGGYIWVYSHPGQGTTFKIYLPGQKKEVAQVYKKPAASRELMGSETILLVEDDAALLAIAKKIFMSHGYNTLEASDGDLAIKIVKSYKKPIHLLITDVVMPGKDGREVAEQIKAILPEINVLFMSGYTDNVIVHHGILDPGVNFIQKPFSPVQLVIKAREILDSVSEMNSFMEKQK